MNFININVLFAHLCSVLSGSQVMSAFQINPCTLLTVIRLMDCTFPAIKSTDDKRTPYVTSGIVGYIYALLIRSSSTQSPSIIQTPPTLVHFEVRNEKMVCEELETMKPEDFSTDATELRDCLVDY
jgi:hypothetical protein